MSSRTNSEMYILFYLKRAHRLAQSALIHVDATTEYLRDELEQHAQHLDVLLSKMEQEEHLRRDRDALLSAAPYNPDDQGLGQWITGKLTDSDS